MEKDIVSRDKTIPLGIIVFCLSAVAMAQTSLPLKKEVLRPSVPSANAELRLWQMADSVKIRYFDPEEIQVSPDKRKLFYISFRGDLGCDCNIYELDVFSVDDIRRLLSTSRPHGYPKIEPIGTISRRSAQYHARGIWGARWDEGGTSISFEAYDDRGLPQLYRYRVKDRTVISRTEWVREATSFVWSDDAVMTDMYVPLGKSREEYPVHAITRAELRQALTPGDDWNAKLTTFIAGPTGAPWGIGDSDPWRGQKPGFSPDGRWIVVARLPTSPNAKWENYEALSRLATSGGLQEADIPQFFLIDTAGRECRTLFDAPTGYATVMGMNSRQLGLPTALWSEDSAHVVLVNTSLPLSGDGDELSGDEDEDRRKTAYIVEYDVENRKWQAIEPLEVRDSASGLSRKVNGVEWVEHGRAILVRHESAGKPTTGTVYRLSGKVWVPALAPSMMFKTKSGPSESVSGLLLEIKQGVNEPPVAVASNGEREVALSGPDAALEGIAWARSEPFEWESSSGKKLTGGLLLPSGSKHAAPLVIQAYVYSRDKFHPDGPYRHVYAAQSLVRRGMAVLNLTIPDVDDPSSTGTPRELAEFSNRVDSAVKELAARGVVDESRVGLIGFSRAGFLTYYRITHPTSVPIGAAIIDDAFPGTYTYYLELQADSAGREAQFNSLYGGSFWENKTSWLEREPSFNVDKVVTPALFSLHDQSETAYALETVGAFSLNHRPIEYLMYPFAGHMLGTPRQRFASQDATVDWMSFWLQQYEDPSAAKRTQYERWRKIKRDWEATKLRDKETPNH